jgi:hypothetical protein
LSDSTVGQTPPLVPKSVDGFVKAALEDPWPLLRVMVFAGCCIEMCNLRGELAAVGGETKLADDYVAQRYRLIDDEQGQFASVAQLPCGGGAETSRKATLSS